MLKSTEFQEKIELQAVINSLIHDDHEKNNKLGVLDWTLIACEHMGHLMGAVRSAERADIEQEVLHVGAPLFELYQVVVGQSSVELEPLKMVAPELSDLALVAFEKMECLIKAVKACDNGHIKNVILQVLAVLFEIERRSASINVVD